MAKSRENSQQSQAETSVKRLMKKLRRKNDKDKTPTVEPSKPTESPKPAGPSVAVAVVAASKRGPKKGTKKRSTPRKPKGPRRRLRSISDYFHAPDNPEAMPQSDEEGCPIRTWLTTSEWTDEAAKAAFFFLAHYAYIGFEGIKAEFKKEVEGYKSPDYADTLSKANPTKNRDKDLVTCIDGTRVELDDKKRYINASWLYDHQMVENKYILTQEKKTPSKDQYDGPYGKVVRNKFYPVGENAQLELPNTIVSARPRPKRFPYHAWPHLFGVCPVKCPVEDNHVHRDRGLGEIKGCVKRYRSYLVTDSDRWSEDRVLDELYTIAQMQAELLRTEGKPIVLMDDNSGTSRAAILIAVDVIGSLLFSGRKDVTLPSIVKWIRKCRNGAIRNEDDYVFIFRCLLKHLYQYPCWRKTATMTAMYQVFVDEDKKKHDAYMEKQRIEEAKIAAEEKAKKDEEKAKKDEEKAKKDEEKTIKDEVERKEREKAEQERLREESEKRKKKKKFPFF